MCGSKECCGAEIDDEIERLTKQRDELAEAFTVLLVSHGREFWDQKAIQKFDAILAEIEAQKCTE
jgi:hypothetical protein